MSFDLAVWHTKKRLTDKEAGKLYEQLCDSLTDGVASHPNVSAFYNQLIAKYPEIDSVPDDRIDDSDFCPWSCAIDLSDGHVIMSCVWPQAENVKRTVFELAYKPGLAIYDPQEGRIVYPDGLQK